MGRWTRDALLRIATSIEGHPDNAAAALLGGFVVSASTPDGVEAIRFDVPRELRAVLFIPELRLSTAAMRRALPKNVPLADAVANLGAVGVGVAGLAAGRTDLLARMTVDRLHEPYRAKVYPQLPRLVEAAREAGALGACLSGAGSTILAFVEFDDGDLAGRGSARGGRSRHRSRGSHPRRPAPQRRGQGGLDRLRSGVVRGSPRRWATVRDG